MQLTLEAHPKDWHARPGGSNSGSVLKLVYLLCGYSSCMCMSGTCSLFLQLKLILGGTVVVIIAILISKSR